MRIFLLLLHIVAIILAIIGAGYVFYADGEASLWYIFIPIILVIVTGVLRKGLKTKPK